MDRNERKRIAQDTLTILKTRQYAVDSNTVSIAQAQDNAFGGTRVYTIGTFSMVRPTSNRSAKFQVYNETTLSGVVGLKRQGYENIACLNAGSPKSPGGGFLGGGDLSEHRLIRASGLYGCLAPWDAYYAANRKCGDYIYTDRMIYAPRVPVFRDDAEGLLAEPYTLSILTASPVDRKELERQKAKSLSSVEATMANRIRLMLTVFSANKHRAIVLGAWGCGTFGNPPAVVARQFRQALESDTFRGCFDVVRFSVRDQHPGTVISAFEQEFSTA